MKKIFKTVTLITLCLALLLAQTAWAEADDPVRGVYDALLAEDSSYSVYKAAYAEYFPDAKFEEILEEDGFTLSISGDEYSSGRWTFLRDGDHLTATLSNDDFSGISTILYVINAVGSYYGMDTDVINGYVAGLNTLDNKSDDFTMTEDEENGTVVVRINIAGPWEMSELDQMVLDESALYFGPLDEDSGSIGVNIGKVMMIANGSADDVTILLGEYGELDDVAYQSIINAVSVLQPNGWEDFVANYTELADAEEEGYSVQLNVDDETVAEIIDDAKDSYSFALIRFGK